MMSIDEVPLDWFFRPAVKLDFRHLPDGHVVTGAEVEVELKRIGHELKPWDIVLINTRAGSCIGADEYLTAGCGMGRDSTLYLTSRGVRVAGIDAWGWDPPFVHTRKRCVGDARSFDHLGGTTQAARFPFATWKSYAISTSCHRMDLLSPASLTSLRSWKVMAD